MRDFGGRIWLLAVGTLVALGLALTPPVASAGGGSSIATAPELPLAQLVAGGGQKSDFWRLQLYGGDRITFKASLPPGGSFAGENDEFSLYSPGVDDFSYAGTPAITSNSDMQTIGLTQFTLTSSFTGLGILVICEGGYSESGCSQAKYPYWPMEPYSFTAYVAHATTMTISAPHLARVGAIVTIRASVTSPAGTPVGSCIINGRIAPLAGGRCSRRVRLGRGGSQSASVRFVPEDGWLGAVGHRTIHVLSARSARASAATATSQPHTVFQCKKHLGREPSGRPASSASPPSSDQAAQSRSSAARLLTAPPIQGSDTKDYVVNVRELAPSVPLAALNLLACSSKSTSRTLASKSAEPSSAATRQIKSQAPVNPSKRPTTSSMRHLEAAVQKLSRCQATMRGAESYTPGCTKGYAQFVLTEAVRLG